MDSRGTEYRLHTTRFRRRRQPSISSSSSHTLSQLSPLTPSLRLMVSHSNLFRHLSQPSIASLARSLFRTRHISLAHTASTRTRA